MNPVILGIECDAKAGYHGDEFVWRRGPVLVEIEPAYDSKKQCWDYAVAIWIFYGHADSEDKLPVLSTWRRTAKLCAAYADRQLRKLRVALGAAS